MRGVAAIQVVFLHSTWVNHLSHFVFVRHGYLAVDIFFILSGFVIYGNYVNNVVVFTDASAMTPIQIS